MSSEKAGAEELNFSIFSDCLFNIILEKLNPDGKQKKSRSRRIVSKKELQGSDADGLNADQSDLVEFSDYLAGEVFPSFPTDLRTIAYEVLQDDDLLSDKWSLPLSLSTYEEITTLIPPSVTDSLEAYGLVQPPKSDLQSFLSPVVAAYLATATAPPLKWVETRASSCEICERDWIPLTYHHLVPKAVHTKVLKRGWHDEKQLNSVAWLCRACHSFVHRMASNEELAKEWYTTERICEREDVQRWAKWVGNIRWKKK